MDLYTSLVRLKQEMNGGILPPMTPVTGAALELIDPAFTIGLGALREDYEQRAAGTFPRGGPPSQNEGKRLATRHATYISVGMRNLENRCLVQLKHRLIDLSNRLGRSPSREDAIAAEGPTFVRRVEETFGTWTSGKAQCDLPVHGKFRDRFGRAAAQKWSADNVVEALAAWHEVHGEFPTPRQTMRPRNAKTPYVPPYKTILANIPGVKGWKDAMRQVATRLQIYGGRYGIPEHLKPQESAA